MSTLISLYNYKIKVTSEGKTSREKEVRGESIEALFVLTCSKIPKTHSQFLFSETPLEREKKNILTKPTEVL